MFFGERSIQYIQRFVPSPTDAVPNSPRNVFTGGPIGSLFESLVHLTILDLRESLSIGHLLFLLRGRWHRSLGSSGRAFPPVALA